MTPIADMVDAMAQAGATPQAIAVAVRTLEERVTLCVTHHAPLRDASRSVMIPERSKAAVRAARYRENLKKKQALAKANDVAAVDSHGVTHARDASRDGVTADCDLSSLPLNLEKGIQERKEGKKEVIARARGTRLQRDAQLTPSDRQFAISHGVPNPDGLWAEFVDYWIGVPGQRGTKLDWSATWRNRVRAVATFKKGNSNGQGNIIAAADRLNAKLAEFSEPDMLTGVRGEACPPNVRLLPAR